MNPPPHAGPQGPAPAPVRPPGLLPGLTLPRGPFPPVRRETRCRCVPGVSFASYTERVPSDTSVPHVWRLPHTTRSSATAGGWPNAQTPRGKGSGLQGCPPQHTRAHTPEACRKPRLSPVFVTNPAAIYQRFPWVQRVHWSSSQNSGKHIHQVIKGPGNTGEQPAGEAPKVRSGRVPGSGASVPMEMERHPPSVDVVTDLEAPQSPHCGASSRRQGGAYTPFPAPLPGELQASKHGWVLPVTSPHPRTTHSHVIRTRGAPGELVTLEITRSPVPGSGRRDRGGGVSSATSRVTPQLGASLTHLATTHLS